MANLKVKAKGEHGRVIDITPAFAAAEWTVPALPVQT